MRHSGPIFRPTRAGIDSKPGRMGSSRWSLRVFFCLQLAWTGLSLAMPTNVSAESASLPNAAAAASPWALNSAVSSTVPATGEPVVNLRDEATRTESKLWTLSSSKNSPLAVNPWSSLPPLVAALFILGAIAVACRRWKEFRMTVGPAERDLRILDSLSLGNRGTVVLLKCRESYALVGCDPQGLRAITFVPPVFEETWNTSACEPDSAAADIQADPFRASQRTVLTVEPPETEWPLFRS